MAPPEAWRDRSPRQSSRRGASRRGGMKPRGTAWWIPPAGGPIRLPFRRTTPAHHQQRHRGRWTTGSSFIENWEYVGYQAPCHRPMRAARWPDGTVDAPVQAKYPSR